MIFDPATSDLDFLAIFEDSERPGISESYFNALRELRNLFGRKVDLLTLDSLTNPFLVDAVQRDRVVLCEKVDGIVIAKEPRMYLHEAAPALTAISRYLNGKTLGLPARRPAASRGGTPLRNRRRGAESALEDAPIHGCQSDLSAIVSFRNILVHEYAGVGNPIVWDLAQQRAPALLSEIEKLLRERSVPKTPGTTLLRSAPYEPASAS